MAKGRNKLLHPPHLKFKGFLAENNIRLQEIADIIGTTRETVCQKNNGYQNYTMQEVDLICTYYHLSADIFRIKSYGNATKEA